MSDVFLRQYPLYFLRQGFLLTWNSLILGHKPQGSSCFHLTSARIIGVCLLAWLLCAVVRSNSGFRVCAASN